jgi:hypothetical protein
MNEVMLTFLMDELVLITFIDVRRYSKGHHKMNPGMDTKAFKAIERLCLFETKIDPAQRAFDHKETDMPYFNSAPLVE